MKLNVNEIMKKLKKTKVCKLKKVEFQKNMNFFFEIIANFLKGKFEVLILGMPFVCHFFV